MKQQKAFEFEFPLTRKVVRNCRTEHEHVGNLLVEGFGYFHPSGSVLDINERYTVDIDYVKFNGVDVKPVLEVTSDVMDDIFDAAVRHVAYLFENDNTPDPEPQRSPLFEQLAESIRLYNKTFYGI